MSSLSEPTGRKAWRKVAPEELEVALGGLVFGKTKSLRRWWHGPALLPDERARVLERLRDALPRATGDAAGKLLLLHYDLTKSLDIAANMRRPAHGDRPWPLVVEGLLARRVSPRRIVGLLWHAPWVGDLGLRSALVSRFVAREVGKDELPDLVDNRRFFRERSATALAAIRLLDDDRALELLARRFADLAPQSLAPGLELLGACGADARDLLEDEPGRFLRAPSAHALRELVSIEAIAWDDVMTVLETTNVRPSPEVARALHEELDRQLERDEPDPRLRDYLARSVWHDPRALDELDADFLVRLLRVRARVGLSASTLLPVAASSLELFRAFVDDLAGAPSTADDRPDPRRLLERIPSLAEGRVEALDHFARRLPAHWARIPTRDRQALLRDAYDGRPQSLALLTVARQVAMPCIPACALARSTPTVAQEPCAFVLLDPEQAQDLALVLSPLELAEPEEWFAAAQELRLLRVDASTRRVLLARSSHPSTNVRSTLATAGIDIATRFAMRIPRSALPTTLDDMRGA